MEGLDFPAPTVPDGESAGVAKLNFVETFDRAAFVSSVEEVELDRFKRRRIDRDTGLPVRRRTAQGDKGRVDPMFLENIILTQIVALLNGLLHGYQCN